MKKNKKVLITGITGQDGIFLSKELVENDNYEIIGLSRKNNLNSFNKKLKTLKFDLNKFQNIKIINIDLTEKPEVKKLIKDNKFDTQQ